MNNKEQLQEATLKALQEDNEKEFEQRVELNGVKRTLYSQDELDCFNAIKNTIHGLENYVTNFMIELSLNNIHVDFKTGDGEGEFEVTFSKDSFGKVTNVQTTYSNQNITYDFIRLAELLYELKN